MKTAPRFIVMPDDLVELGTQIFLKSGAPFEHARRVSESLVASNLAGLDSHGIIRIMQYVNAIETGKLAPAAEPEKVVDNGTVLVVDGRCGFGQVAAAYAMDIAIDKAKSAGVGIVGLKRTYHIGRLGAYVLQAARAGLAGFATANGGGPNVAPFGAAERVFGTNPIACAVPSREGEPILIDLATGATAEGKVRTARNRGETLEPGVLMDREGRPSRDPDDFYKGGAILTAAGHRGSALSLLAELLSGILTGSGCSAFPGYEGDNGALFIVMDPARFRPVDAFLEDVERMKRRVKGARPARGFDEVLLPGEPEFRLLGKRRKEGVPIEDETWQGIQSLARRLGVSAAAQAKTAEIARG